MHAPLTGFGDRDRFLQTFSRLFPSPEWPDAKRDALLSQLHFRRIEAGAFILREGQACASVPFVVDGGIRVFKSADSGREITLYRIEPGQSCVMSVGCGPGIGAFPANVVAELPTLAAFMPAVTLRRLFSESESFREFVLEQFAGRVAEVMELVQEVAFSRVDERLAQHLAERAAAGGTAEVRATHQELADNVGTSREVVSRILKDWEARSMLELSRGSIRLLKGFEPPRAE
jgi:CRP/FNR family transcriptional regulator, anaerobic regulatory protein